MLGIIFNFRKRNFDPSLCNHCRCIFSPGRMMHIQLIHDVELPHGVELVSKVKAAAADEPTVLSFLERAQERDEAFMERMAEAERESRREQQKFSMDALKMLGNIIKDVANGKD